MVLSGIMGTVGSNLTRDYLGLNFVEMLHINESNSLQVGFPLCRHVCLHYYFSPSLVCVSQPSHHVYHVLLIDRMISSMSDSAATEESVC